VPTKEEEKEKAKYYALFLRRESQLEFSKAHDADDAKDDYTYIHITEYYSVKMKWNMFIHKTG
jgi:hypothetical protein